MSSGLFDWLVTYKFNVSFTVIILVLYLAFRAIVGPRIRAHAEKGKLKDSATDKALGALNILLIIGAISSCLIVWGVDFKGLFTLSASILAVTGVAMFAGWSVLSNITAFFILLPHTSYKRGNFIRVLDADNYIEGYISEINLFNTKLITENREVIIYPNNLLLTRPTIVNPRNRLESVGKIISNAKPKGAHKT